MRFTTILAATAAAGMMLSTAHAATITSSTQTLPQDNFTAPSSSSGDVAYPVMGNLGGQYVSPFGNSTSPFGSVQNGYVEYDFSRLFSSLSLIWGSPDSYNTLQFLAGGSIVDSIGGSAVGDPANNYFVTVQSDVAFDAVRLASTSPAFEYSNVSAVPLPASAPMFGAALLALGGLGYAAKRKKATASA